MQMALRLQPARDEQVPHLRQAGLAGAQRPPRPRWARSVEGGTIFLVRRYTVMMPYSSLPWEITLASTEPRATSFCPCLTSCRALSSVSDANTGSQYANESARTFTTSGFAVFVFSSSSRFGLASPLAAAQNT